jgi:Domain of unknown function (DUF1816)
MRLPFLTQPNYHWWIKISTTTPCCTYYFGPFDDREEAKIYQPGYVEDLVEEKAQGIKVETKRCQPQWLTIEDKDPVMEIRPF